jgi:hypothetical protein
MDNRQNDALTDVEPEVFATAARDLRWHYQTAILSEFLPSLIGADRFCRRVSPVARRPFTSTCPVARNQAVMIAVIVVRYAAAS